MTILQDILAAANWNLRVTENFRTVAPAGLYGVDPTTSVGLTFGYKGGQFNGNAVADGTVVLGASSTSYIVAKRSDGTVSASTNTTNWLNTTDYLQLFSVVTGSSTISSYVDMRQAYGGAGGSGGGMSNPMTSSGDIIYGDTGGTPLRLAKGSNGQYLSLVSGVPAWVSFAGLSNPMIAAGDLILGGTSGAAGRLAIGSSGQVLTVSGGTAAWATPSSGGMTNPMTTSGDLITGGASGTPGRLAAGTNGYVLTMVSGAPAWAAASGGGGGLTNITEGINTSAPNGTINAVSLAVTGGSTDADFVLSPKGNGAFQLQVADNTTTGGNKRGTNAIDLQVGRLARTQVASGTNSFAAGYRNTASGFNATAIGVNNNVDGGSSVGIGDSNTITNGSFALGLSNTSSGGNSVALGNANTASGAGSVSAGSNNQSTGTDSVALGNGNLADADYAGTFGTLLATRGIKGVQAFGAAGARGNSHGVQGSTQTEIHTLFIAGSGSSNAIPTTVGSGTPTAANQIVLNNNSVAVYVGEIIGIDTSTGDTATWTFKVAVQRKANAGSTTVLASSVTSLFASSGASTWTAGITADTSNGGLTFTCAGSGTNTITWGVSARGLFQQSYT